MRPQKLELRKSPDRAFTFKSHDWIFISLLPGNRLREIDSAPLRQKRKFNPAK